MSINDQPDTRTMTTREASMAQIRAAVRAFSEGDWASAVTLAGAAEGRCPTVPKQVTLRSLFAMFVGDSVNDVRNWMKHDRQPDSITVIRRDLIMILGRAITEHEIAYGTQGSVFREIGDLLKAYEADVTAGKTMPT